MYNSFDLNKLINIFKYIILVYKKNIKKELKVIRIIILNKLEELFIIINILNHFIKKNIKGGVLAKFKVIINNSIFKL